MTRVSARLGVGDRGVDICRRFLGGEMGAGDEKGCCAADELPAVILNADSHVRAIVAIVQQGKRILIAYGQKRHAGETRRIGPDVRNVDALPGQLIPQEAAVMIIPHARYMRDPKSKPRGANGDIGGTTANILGEGGGLLETASHLIAVNIHDSASHRYEIKHAHRPVHSPTNGMHIIAGRQTFPWLSISPVRNCSIVGESTAWHNDVCVQRERFELRIDRRSDG